jgi:sugar phosphate isomerase/epimerase
MIRIGSKIDEVRVDGSLASFRRDLEAFQNMGMEAVELPVHGLDAIRNGTLDRRRVTEVLSILRDHEFAYSVHAPNPLNLMDQRDPSLHEAAFHASLEFASAVGARVLVYHAGRFVPEETFPVSDGQSPVWEERNRLLARESEALAELAIRWDHVTICVENARPYLHHSPYCYAERLDGLGRLVGSLGLSSVRVNLDLGHLFMASRFYRFDPVDAVRGVRDIIGHVHIHDNFGASVFSHEK